MSEFGCKIRNQGAVSFSSGTRIRGSGRFALVVLSTQNDLRRVRDLSFCYICGRPFEAGDQTNHDHVPPKSVFALQDRQPLKLKTHAACNERYSLTDEKIGQLISLQRGQYPQDPADRKLQLAPLGGKMGAIMNLNIDAALWRWIAAFHAALLSGLSHGSRTAGSKKLDCFAVSAGRSYGARHLLICPYSPAAFGICGSNKGA